MANADGSDQRQLTEPGRYCCMLRMSPDDTRILVMPGEDRQAPPLAGGTLNIQGSHYQRLRPTDPSLNLAPQSWSPDGNRIAFEGFDDSHPERTGVYTARASDGGGLVRVTHAPGHPHDTPLDYSPDGSQLVFYRAAAAEPNFPIDVGGSLWVVNVDGSHARRLKTPGVRSAPWARGSPDGTKILFGTERDQPNGALWTIRPDGSDLTKLFDDAQGRFPFEPTWSPDGRHIMFVLHPTSDYFVHLDNGLFVIDAHGEGLTKVIGGEGFKAWPEWWR
jgi:Tol biopolymer transport system component